MGITTRSWTLQTKAGSPGREHEQGLGWGARRGGGGDKGKNHLALRHCGLQQAVPVDQAHIPIDQPVGVHAQEGLLDGRTEQESRDSETLRVRTEHTVSKQGKHA